MLERGNGEAMVAMRQCLSYDIWGFAERGIVFNEAKLAMRLTGVDVMLIAGCLVLR
jgi:hypothetical protein